jgi:tripartite ATP-independent transporter DctM subunit
MPFLRWLKIGADSVAVLLLAAMFCSFMLQIIFRYIFNHPLSWTLEACLITWLWTVFWGCGLLLRDKDHVRFDILYLAAPRKLRRLMAGLAAIVFLIAYAFSLPATADYVAFMKIESSSSLKIRLDYIFGIYLLFVVGVLGRYLWRLLQIIRDQDAFILCLVAIFGLAALGAPIAHSIIVGAITFLAVNGQDLALAAEQIIQGLYESFVLLAVPLFIVAANIMNAGTVSDRLLQFCVALVGRFRGGLGHVNVVASIIFSGMSGSAIADAAGIGKVIIRMMTKDNRYTPGFAAAITAASATIGPIIPPSIPMVLYSLVSDASIGYLFLGGVIPGLLMGLVLMVMIAYKAKTLSLKAEAPVPLRAMPGVTLRAFPALMLPVILLFGIYGGATTPTEAAAVAAAYALILTAFFYRSLNWKGLYQILLESARSSAAVGLVIGGALILNYIVASENIPNQLAGVLKEVDIDPLMFLLGINLILLLLGCVLDATTLILVVIPLFIPSCRALGIDLVHFGVVVVVNSMIGLITPPYGILLFVINATTGIPLRSIIKEIVPFLMALLVALATIVLSPDLVLWLPRLLGYNS